jgi:hypothetical protein
MHEDVTRSSTWFAWLCRPAAGKLPPGSRRKRVPDGDELLITGVDAREGYANTAKRIKKAIADNMKHLVKFGLFEDPKHHMYVITSKGRKYVEILSPRDELPIAAE